MKRDSLSVAVACLFGAFAGGLIALDISEHFAYGHYFWVLGALVGGIIACVIVEAKRIPDGIARAYRATFAWRPNLLFWKTFFACFCGISAIFMTATGVVSALAIAMGNRQSLAFILTLCLFTWIVFSLAGLLLSMLTRLDSSAELLTMRRDMWAIARHSNPVAAVYWTGFGLGWLTRRIPAAILSTAQFVRLTFIYIHSELMTLCFVDAALGACVGYFAGNAFIGALAGAALGLANYELVSVRLLKLFPNRSR